MRENARAVRRQKLSEPGGETLPGDGPDPVKRECADPRIVPLFGRRVAHPGLRRFGPGCRVETARFEQAGGDPVALHDIRARVEGPEPVEKARRVGALQVELGGNEDVGQHGLAQTFLVSVELGEAGHCVHGDDHAGKPVAFLEVLVGEQGMDDRRRVGETGGFNDHTVQGRDFTLELLNEKLAQRVHEVAADGAAKAAGIKQHHVFADFTHQEMVERDVAELVDEDGGARERFVLQKFVEQRGLAAAEKARQHEERQALLECRAHAKRLNARSFKPERMTALIAPAAMM